MTASRFTLAPGAFPSFPVRSGIIEATDAPQLPGDAATVRVRFDGEGEPRFIEPAHIAEAVPALVAQFRAIMSDDSACGLPSAEMCRAVIEHVASALPAGPELWALWYVAPGSELAELCEFDGSTCYECYSDASKAWFAAERLNRDTRSAGRCIVARVPNGVAANADNVAVRAGGPVVEWQAGFDGGWTTCAARVSDLDILATAPGPRPRPQFFITYETVTPESAEIGDAAERGYLHPNGGRDPLETMGERDAYAFPLSSVRFHLGHVEDSGSWFTETDSDRCDYRTGAVTRYSLHPPRDITPSSYRRLARALGARS